MRAAAWCAGRRLQSDGARGALRWVACSRRGRSFARWARLGAVGGGARAVVSRSRLAGSGQGRGGPHVCWWARGVLCFGFSTKRREGWPPRFTCLIGQAPAIDGGIGLAACPGSGLVTHQPQCWRPKTGCRGWSYPPCLPSRVGSNGGIGGAVPCLPLPRAH